MGRKLAKVRRKARHESASGGKRATLADLRDALSNGEVFVLQSGACVIQQQSADVLSRVCINATRVFARRRKTQSRAQFARVHA